MVTYQYPSDIPVAFVAFLKTEEEDHRGRPRDVIYCYELQVAEGYRGRGIGATLLSRLERVCIDTSTPLVMLTCFNANKGALLFYRQHGFSIDEISPSKYGSTAKAEVEYEILSKRVY